jgi:diguanylate cyclase (GGDEF)-like protein
VRDLIDRRMEVLKQAIQLIGMSIASLQLRLKLEHQSIRDPLTGLFNRHFMQITLEKEMARCKRKQNTLGVLMLDVDHFKMFNDRFGHSAGDSVLQSVAAVLQTSVRTEDFVCRYGGEEFIVVFPEISAVAALERAEGIRRMVADLENRFEASSNLAITISIGIALYSGDGTDAGELVRRADQALYRAKNSGRNRVVLHEMSVAEILPFGLPNAV